ncbi:uncharacterized protein LOC143237640 isoform X2 [Tachypleus tridentatus]|uniref:uncharacterized protein LOC143237640 isoform X2 n=1 Tax=Tachypleus tridentatus TaxID=6853 RepID=UPI003FD30337
MIKMFKPRRQMIKTCNSLFILLVCFATEVKGTPSVELLSCRFENTFCEWEIQNEKQPLIVDTHPEIEFPEDQSHILVNNGYFLQLSSSKVQSDSPKFKMTLLMWTSDIDNRLEIKLDSFPAIPSHKNREVNTWEEVEVNIRVTPNKPFVHISAVYVTTSIQSCCF